VSSGIVVSRAARASASPQWFAKGFYWSCIVVLCVTLSAKLIASLSNAAILNYQDRLLYLSYREILWLAAGYEMGLACILVFSSNPRIKGLLVAVTGGQFLLYRYFKAAIGDAAQCPCLGTIPRSLGLSDAFTYHLLIVIASYFLCGGLITYTYFRKPGHTGPAPYAAQGMGRDVSGTGWLR
jgi:hypothetical protein